MLKPVLLRGALLAACAAASACDRSPSYCDAHLSRFKAMPFEEKVQRFRELSPKRDFTSLSAMRKSITWGRVEEKMVCVFLSVPSADLSRFKFELEYDGDNKDLVEYIFHDIDNPERQKIIKAHFATSPDEHRIKVLTDVDDTFFANWVDDGARYGDGTIYPGVMEFYQALHEEPFETGGVPITALSARPDARGTFLSEEATLRKLRALSANRLRPSGQSGKLVNSTLGSIGGLVRGKPYFQELMARSPFKKHEDGIGETKFMNAMHFAAAFPEYRYVFVGDSGQADALTAQLLTRGELAEGTSRPITTFIHDLRRREVDPALASDSFDRVKAEETAGHPGSTGRAIITFRNYIQAAARAYDHRATLDNLIDANELLTITQAALEGFERVAAEAPFRATLESQYKADAQKALALLTASSESTGTIQQRLDNGFWHGITPTP